MLKTLETTGKTIAEATQKALDELRLERDDVSVEVLENPKPGFLGIGATPAKIRVSYSVGPETEVEEFLNGLISRMNVSATVSVSTDEEGSIIAAIEGDNAGALIGRRGDTLDAIQHITRCATNKQDDDRARIMVDVQGYRKKREETLEKLALRVAEKVVRFRRSVTLEPMNSYERHCVHVALQNYKGVSTYSTGNEPNRRIIVAYGAKPVQGQAARS